MSQLDLELDKEKQQHKESELSLFVTLTGRVKLIDSLASVLDSRFDDFEKLILSEKGAEENFILERSRLEISITS